MVKEIVDADGESMGTGKSANVVEVQ